MDRDASHSGGEQGQPSTIGAATPALVRVDERRPDGYDGSCLRPLGMCELGGSCDVCWYRPDHPRFQRSG